MKLNRVTLKSYFERGDVPTQQEFAHLIDSIPNFIEDKPVLKINNTAPDEFGNLTLDIPEQQPLQYDAQPTQASTKLVNSGSLYTTLQNYFTSTQVDNAPVKNSTKLVLSGALFTELAKKVNTSDVTESITQSSKKIPTAGAVYTELAKKVEVEAATQKLNPAIIPDQDFTQYGPATDIADNDTGVLQDIDGNKKRYSISGLLARLQELLANSFIKPISGAAQTIRQTEGSVFEILSEQADTEGNITASTSLTVGPDGAKVGGQDIITADELEDFTADFINKTNLSQAPGARTDVAMSEKAVTDAIVANAEFATLLPYTAKALQSAKAGTATRLRWVSFGDSMGMEKSKWLLPSVASLIGGYAGACGGGPLEGITTNPGSTATGEATDYNVWFNTMQQLPAGTKILLGIGGVNATFDTVKIFYIKNGGGSFKVQVGGVDVAGFTNVSTAGAGELGVISFTVSRAQQELSVVGLTGTVLIAKGYIEDSTVSGVMSVNLSLGGMDMSNWVNVPSSTALANLAIFLTEVKGTVFSFEMKEIAENVASRVTALLDTVQAAAPKMDVVLFSSTPDDKEAATGDNKKLGEILAKEAKQRGAYYFDSGKFFNYDYQRLIDLGWHGDGTHPVSDLQRYLAQTFLQQSGLLTYLNASGLIDSFYGKLTAKDGIYVTQDLRNVQFSIEPEKQFKFDAIVKVRRWLQFYNRFGTEFMRFDFFGNNTDFLPALFAVGAGNARLQGRDLSKLRIRRNVETDETGDLEVRAIQQNVVAAGASVGGVLTLDFTKGSVQEIILSESITSVVVAAGKEPILHQNIKLIIWQGGNSNFTIAGWAPAFKFAGGAAPVFATAAGKKNILNFRIHAAGEYLEETRSLNI